MARNNENETKDLENTDDSRATLQDPENNASKSIEGATEDGDAARQAAGAGSMVHEEPLKTADEEGEAKATTAAEAKSLSAVTDPDRPIGDHLAQKFSRTPENPQLAPGLDPESEGKVKLVMTTSDSIARGSPDVCFVHPEMVGDYLRAGWTQG